MMRLTPHLATLLLLTTVLGGCLTESVDRRIAHEAFIGREFENCRADAIYAPVYGKYVGTVTEGGVIYHDFRFDGLLTPKSLIPLQEPGPRHLRILVPSRALSTDHWGEVTETPDPAETRSLAILFLRWESPAKPETRVGKEFWAYLHARHPEIRTLVFDNAHLVYLNLRDYEEFVVHRLPSKFTPPQGWRRISVSTAIEWRVRRYGRYLFPHLLYAATAPADILTFPLQAVLAIGFGIE